MEKWKGTRSIQEDQGANKVFLYGINPIREALRASTRRVERLYVARGRTGPEIAELLALAKSLGVEILWKERKDLDRLTGVCTHQGIVGVATTKVVVSVDEIVQRCGPTATSLLLILDGLKDPRNFGALLRSAEAFGVAGVIIPKDRAVSITGTVAKTSAGAVEYIPVAQVVNIAYTLLELKKRGFWIVGGDVEGGQPCYTYRFREATGLVLGEEGRGLRPLVRRSCDSLLTIPLYGRMTSLNVAVAGGIFLYEIRRQQEEMFRAAPVKK